MPNKKKIEYNYVPVPFDLYVLALLGEKWKRIYGEEEGCFHFHDYLEVGYCYKGSGVLLVNNQSYRYTDQMFSVIPKNFPHTTCSDVGTVSEWEYLFINVDELLEDLYISDKNFYKGILRRMESTPFFLRYEENNKLANLILTIMDEIRIKKEFYKESVKGMLLAMMIEIARMNKLTVYNENITKSQRLIISNAIEYIDACYSEDITVKMLAEHCYISETHFRRIFVETMNMTPLKYLNIIRIHKACDLLRKSDESIKSISEKTGFSTLSTFNRNFKEVLHITPNIWRNSM